jgi:pimeloyl-ACP methyl ester carboxylesterase
MILHFADCVLDTDGQSLSRGGEQVAVEPQVFELIHLLVGNAERMVSRDEIVQAVWGGRIVSESAVSSRIASARKAVGDDGRRQAVIRTVQRRGLKVVVPVAMGAADAPSPAPASVTIRYATADDGATLAFALGGSGPPVVAVNNFMTDVGRELQVEGMHELHDALMRQNGLLRYDQRGSGLSRGVPGPVDIGQGAEDLRAVLDAAGLERTAVLSLSAGALTALTFAARYPERVSRMVVVSGYVDGRLRRAGKTDPAGDPIRGLIEEGWRDPHSVLMTAFMTAYLPDGPDAIVRGLATFFQSNTSSETILAFRDMINLASVGDCLARIACPVLVIHARRDRIHPLSEAQKMAAGLNRGELLVLDSGNHLPLPGQPGWETYLSAALGFLRD